MAVPTLERLNTAALRDTVRTFRDTVRDHAHGLNRLNVYPVPDGDTGTNMARTLDAVVAEMETAADDDHHATCDAISHGSLMGARGNSGVILSQIMRGFAGTVKEHADVQGAKFAEALQAAATGAYDAVLKPIEGTILTVCRESADAAKEAADAGGSLVEVARAARAAGKLALDNTPEQLQVLKDAGVVDAGGAGFLLLLDSVLYVVDGEPLPIAEPDDGTSGAVGAAFEVVAHRHAEAPGELDVSEQRYEVMYFLELPDERIRDFKEHWGAIGDSIVVVGGDGLWNCHVHTNEIGARRSKWHSTWAVGPSRFVSATCSKRSTRSTRSVRPNWHRRRWRHRSPMNCRRSPPLSSQSVRAPGWSNCSRSSVCRASSPEARR